MKTPTLLAVLILAILMANLACGGGHGEKSPLPTPTASISTNTPTPTTLCEIQTAAIQKAVDIYHKKHGKWPTADGKPGDIRWDKLVPSPLPNRPSTDFRCNWQIDDNPKGIVCLLPENFC